MNRDKQIEEMHNAVLAKHGTTLFLNIKDAYDALVEAGYRKSTDLAREIFEEIESLMLDGAIGGKYPIKVINPDKFAELKKKYTEEITEGEG